MEPGKTSFFQALGVPTKIARGTIEITSDLKLIEAGLKVGPSEATLLNMLNISPFTYGMGVAQIYDDGNTFSSSVLDITEDQLLKTLGTAISTIASLSLALNFPTLPSVIHSTVNAYKKILAVAIETEYSWPEIEELKDRIANPDAYAAAAPAAGGAAAGGAAEAEAPKEDEKEDEESDEDGGFGGLLFVSPHFISRPIPPIFLCSRELTWLKQRLNVTNHALRWCLEAGNPGGNRAKALGSFAHGYYIGYTPVKTNTSHLMEHNTLPQYRDKLKSNDRCGSGLA